MAGKGMTPATRRCILANLFSMLRTRGSRQLGAQELLSAAPNAFAMVIVDLLVWCSAGIRPQSVPRDGTDPRPVGDAGHPGRGGGGGDHRRCVAGRWQGRAGRRLLPRPRPPFHRHVRTISPHPSARCSTHRWKKCAVRICKAVTEVNCCWPGCLSQGK